MACLTTNIPHETCDMWDINNEDSVNINDNMETTVTTIGGRDWSGVYTQRRAGIIPCIIEKGVPMYCFGRDTTTGDLTDFGGGVSANDRTPIDTALRELSEEGLRAFGEIKQKDLVDQVAIYDKDMLIIFIHLSETTSSDIGRIFDANVSKTHDPEVNKLVWMDAETLSMHLTNNSSNRNLIYSPVRSLVCSAVRSGLDLGENYLYDQNLE